MTMSDAAVALRSLPRRFKEVASGPVGDDAWERLVRTPDVSGKSALGWVAQTSALLSELGIALSGLATTVKPTVDLAPAEATMHEVASSVTVASVLGDLSSGAERAASAIEARRHDDLDRHVSVDGSDVAASDLVVRIVRAAVANIRHAAAALDAARGR